MRLRPAQTHWFETYVPRNETVYALEALAATGVVQLELDTRLTTPLDLDTVGRLIGRFEDLRARYRDRLPAAVQSHEGQVDAPELTARRALDCLEAWRAPVDGLLRRQAQLADERQNLLLVRECCAAMRSSSGDTAHLSRPGQFLYKGVFACPRTREMPANICAVIDEFVPGREHNFFVIADHPDCRDIIEQAYHSDACQSLQVPDWLPAEAHEQHVRIGAKLSEIALEAGQIQRALEEKKHDPALAVALGDIDRLAWYAAHAEHLATTRRLCHVTGWTTADDAQELQAAFLSAGIHGAVRFARPPEFSRPPVHLGLPWWARPFLFIPEMMGTPDSTEIDSSKLLAVIVPLLFGYMFPDIGHGLMLTLFSAALYRRWPAGRFLIPCGISAMLFGLVFGEVFGLQGVLEPLWISPLEHPLEILFAPLSLGVALILLGLVFNGIEALWRGEGREWLLRDAAVLVMYVAVLTGLFVPAALWVAAAGLAWFVLGQLLGVASGRLANLGRNLAGLLQSVFELGLHTLSFLRVGAFALAHAGLSSALLGLTEGISSDLLHALLLVAGHIFIVVLEGLVVFVQTTRLVLFEFFTHFLRAEGRLFNPMAGPPHGTDRGQA